MGTYDDEKMPEGVLLPLSTDEANDAITFADGLICSRYGGLTIEQSVLTLERRKAEFVVKLANGELIVRKDKKGADHVFKRASQIVKNGKIVIEYEEIKVPVAA